MKLTLALLIALAAESVALLSLTTPRGRPALSISHTPALPAYRHAIARARVRAIVLEESGGGGGGGGGGTAGDSRPEKPEEGDEEGGLLGVWKRYEALLEEKPLLMKALTPSRAFSHLLTSHPRC